MLYSHNNKLPMKSWHNDVIRVYALSMHATWNFKSAPSIQLIMTNVDLVEEIKMKSYDEFQKHKNDINIVLLIFYQTPQLINNFFNI